MMWDCVNCPFQIWKTYDADCSGFLEADELQVMKITLFCINETLEYLKIIYFEFQNFVRDLLAEAKREVTEDQLLEYADTMVCIQYGMQIPWYASSMVRRYHGMHLVWYADTMVCIQ